jgi:outer membrane protein TolC
MRKPDISFLLLWIGLLLIPPCTALLTGEEQKKTESYTLDQYLEKVSQYSRDLNIARKNILQAELGVRQAKASLFPRIALQGGYARNFLDLKQPSPVAVDTTVGGIAPLIYKDVDVNKDNNFSLGLSASQVIFDMRAYDALKYGQEYENITRTGYKEADRTIRNAAKKLYFLAVLQEEVVKVKEASEQNEYNVYLDARKKYEAGVVQELEVLRAEVNWKTKRSEISQAQKDAELARINLKTLAGIPLDTELILEERLETVPPFPSSVPLEEVLGQRSDYELLLRQKRLAELSVALARDEAYPSVAGILSWNRSYSDDGFNFDDPKDIFQLGFQVSIPLYTGGAVSSKVNSALLEIEKTELEINKLRDTITTEIRRIELTLQEARERIDTAIALRETAERAYQLAQHAHRNGLITTLEMNDSAVQLEGARLQYSLAVFDYLTTYFDWETAMGR